MLYEWMWKSITERIKQFAAATDYKSGKPVVASVVDASDVLLAVKRSICHSTFNITIKNPWHLSVNIRDAELNSYILVTDVSGT